MTITPLRPELEAPPPLGSPSPAHRWWTRAIAVVAVCAVVVGAAGWFVLRPRTASVPAARQFVDRYVDGEGRVARPDQGGDTVSEGQAYAMLLAVAAHDGRRFARVWSWTERNLQRPDGLLSWHWDGGHVVDAMPATDADLVAAWALTLAAQRFDGGYRVAAQRVAGGILAYETVPIDGGLVLAAGPWARTSPYRVNPSYAAAPALDALFRATGDPVWRTLADSSRRVLDGLTGGGQRLPPDWAGVDPAGRAWPTPPPDDAGRPPEFGLEAARLIVWSAMACNQADRAVAARAEPLLARAQDRPAVRTLDGDKDGDNAARSPVMLVAVAASEQAAGHRDAAARSLSDADRLAAGDPRYYAAAWTALARTGLTSGALGACS